MGWLLRSGEEWVLMEGQCGPIMDETTEKATETSSQGSLPAVVFQTIARGPENVCYWRLESGQRRVVFPPRASVNKIPEDRNVYTKATWD